MLIPLIEYPDELSVSVFSPPVGLVIRLTFPPMHGTLVRQLQRALKAKGIDPGEIDGVFGPHTEAAVRAFQLKSKLVPDGEVGAVTFRKLSIKP
jgi:peptidoglycan hydrolase-like protein with peptidoglycan-binding domain